MSTPVPSLKDIPQTKDKTPEVQVEKVVSLIQMARDVWNSKKGSTAAEVIGEMLKKQKAKDEKEIEEPLHKDNIDSEKVVEVIKEHRKEEKDESPSFKMFYTRFSDEKDKSVDQKILEIKEVYEASENLMEWESLLTEAKREVMKDRGFTTSEEDHNR